jgi:hypothetical protein
MKDNLSIKDGFNFGCGFFIAGFVYSLAISVIVFVTFAVLGTGVLGALQGIQ